MRQCLESVTRDSRSSVTHLWLVTCVSGVSVLRESLAQSAQLEWIRCDSMRGTAAQRHHTLFHSLPSTHHTVTSLKAHTQGVQSHTAHSPTGTAGSVNQKAKDAGRGVVCLRSLWSENKVKKRLSRKTS
ncbi:uncharacterized [Tachysurus ichikawai]